MNKIEISFTNKEMTYIYPEKDTEKKDIDFLFRNINSHYSIEADEIEFNLSKEDFYFLIDKKFKINYKRKYTGRGGKYIHTIFIDMNKEEKVF